MKLIKKLTAAGLAFVLTVTPVFSYGFRGDIEVKAEQIGSLSDKVTGTWSYWDGSQDVVQTNAMLLDNLPTRANQGITRWTTENYDNSTGAIDIGEWGTSFMWSYTSDQWGNSAYAIPMSYKATAQGLYVTKPSTTNDLETAFAMEQPEDGTMTDFVVGPAFTAASKKVDKVTDWSYDLVFESSADANVYVKATLAQGSPFSYYEAVGTQTMKIQRMRTSLPCYISYYNGTSIADSTMLILRVYDNHDDARGYSNYDYYAVYVPEGTTWTQSGNSDVNAIGTLTANFPSADKSYMSFAWLCEAKGTNAPTVAIPEIDTTAESIGTEYQKYAYNFITDTKASYSYDYSTSTVTTTYSYTVDKKAESTADGTIMGILPHQYKNMTGYTYLDNTARTIRGTMKFLAGSSYITTLKYTGILPTMMDIDEMDYPTLQGYVDDFMEEFGPTDTAVTKEDYSVNTYDTGKKLNRAVQAMAAAEACGDTESATALLNGIKAELSDWFTWTGDEDEKYFYYDEGTGSLFGFPQSYYSVDGMQDHHFHYGYFINAAAQVVLRDPSFADQYGNIIDELIADIATTEENHPDSRYPKLRYFSQYEGHSWASGHANFGDGNNQESSSEALNSWAGLILYGEATGNQELTELGICLYTTEYSAVRNYWFDVDGDVLDEAFTAKYPYCSMVWGGKYGYETWWTAEPLQVQGINILPMTSASFCYASDQDFILKNFETAQSREAAYTGEDKDVNRWNEIWSCYLALADPEKAIEYFNDECDAEAGDSKAHAYHYIMALEKAGTPDLSVTSDSALSCAFKNADDEMTYVVYNAGTEAKTVTFSDGVTVEAVPGQMTTVSDGEVAGKAAYTVEHYIQQTDGTYLLNQVETKSAKIGNDVTASAKAYDGFVLNENAEGSKISGTVTEDGSLVLRLYYDRVPIEEDKPGQDPSLYTPLGEYDGAEISYYLIRDDLGASIKLLDANLTFYIEYSGDYNSSNTTGYMNNVETPENVYGGVYKFQTTSLQKDSYTTLKIKSGSKLLTMIIKYGNPTGAPVIDDDEIEIPTQDENTPTEAASVILGTTADNTVIVTIVDTVEQQTKGQKYNIYVNSQKVMEGVDAGTYIIDNVSAGQCTVKVTGVLSNIETSGVTKTIKVSGEVYEVPTTSQEPDTTSSQEPDTTSPQEPDTTLPQETSDTENTTTVAGITGETTTAPVASETTTVASVATDTKKVTVAKAKVKSASKKKSARKAKISLKRIKGATKYRIQISKTKKFKKKNILVKKTVKKVKFNIKSKKIKNRKKLYVRARAIKIVDGQRYFGKWSKAKKIKIK